MTRAKLTRTLASLALLGTAIALVAAPEAAQPAQPALAATFDVAAVTPKAVPDVAPPGAPAVQARAYMVMNDATGDVLVSKNAGARRPMASLTKLMTVDVALQKLGLDDYVTVSSEAAEIGEESIQLVAGEQVLVKDLVQAALIQSANDAAGALADAASGGDRKLFVSWMNREARDIGLTRTHFVRPDGLDAPRHYSSARDVTHLARWAMGLDAVRETVRLRAATTSDGRSLSTWNDLLGTFPGVTGVKTGHTDNAGWCQTALLERDGLEIYATILGSPSRERRNRDLAALLRFALKSYRVVRIASERQPLLVVDADYGRPDVPVAVARPLVLPVRVDRPLVEKLIVPRSLELPVKQGQHVGRIRVYSGTKLLAERELVAMRAVAEPGALGKAGWYAGQAARNLFDWP